MKKRSDYLQTFPVDCADISIFHSFFQRTLSSCVTLSIMTESRWCGWHLKGHTDEVLCVEAGTHAHERWHSALLSGGADGTVRLWDLRTNASARCVRVQAAAATATATAAATATAPPIQSTSDTKSQQVHSDSASSISGDVNSVAFGRGQHEQAVFAAMDDTMYAFDLRKSNVVLSEYQYKLQSAAQEEICHININSSGTRICMCDDSGAVEVAELDFSGTGAADWSLGIGQHHVMPGSNTGNAHSNICAAVSFLPHHSTTHALKNESVMSAGMDSKLLKWSAVTGQYQSRFATAANPTTEPGQSVHPPLIHGLALSNDDAVLATALGNGMIGLYDVKQGECLAHLSGHHGQVSAVAFIPGTDDYRLLSTGTDCKAIVWTLNDLKGSSSISADEKQQTSKARKNKRKKKKKKKNKNKNKKDNNESTDANIDSAQDRIAITADETKTQQQQQQQHAVVELRTRCPPLFRYSPQWGFSEADEQLLHSNYAERRFGLMHKPNDITVSTMNKATLYIADQTNWISGFALEN
jgi:WD40 repeat protein